MQRAYTHTCKQTYLKPSSFTVMSKGDQKTKKNKQKNQLKQKQSPKTNKTPKQTEKKKPF